MNRIYLTIFITLFTVVGYANSPYAPTIVGTVHSGADIANYSYDSASNRLSNGHGQTITMGLTTKPETITTIRGTDTFKNGLGGRRYFRVHPDGGKKMYIGGMEYHIDKDGVTRSVIDIRAKGYSPDAQVEMSDGGALKYTYLLKDHLGSPMLTVNDAGVAESTARFDPWGSKVSAPGTANALTEEDEKIRGYTGHELIASANMGHWNGRIFDYEIGAFPGPDKFIQGSSIVALNRFALGQHNNPNVVDPSGLASARSLGSGTVRMLPTAASVGGHSLYANTGRGGLAHARRVDQMLETLRGAEPFRESEALLDNTLAFGSTPIHDYDAFGGILPSRGSHMSNSHMDIVLNRNQQVRTGRGGFIPDHIVLAHEIRHVIQYAALRDVVIPEDVRELATLDRRWSSELDVSSIQTYGDAIRARRRGNANANAFLEADATLFEIRVSEALGVPAHDTRRSYSDILREGQAINGRPRSLGAGWLGNNGRTVLDGHSTNPYLNWVMDRPVTTFYGGAAVVGGGAIFGIWLSSESQ